MGDAVTALIAAFTSAESKPGISARLRAIRDLDMSGQSVVSEELLLTLMSVPSLDGEQHWDAVVISAHRSPTYLVESTYVL